MSERDLEAVRRAYAAWGRQDLRELLAVCSPEVELHPSGAFPGLEPVYKGHDGIRSFWREFYEPWGHFSFEAERLIEGVGRIVGLARVHGRGRDGIEVERQFGHVITVHDGLITRVDSYPDWDSALEAAGVEG